MIEVMVLHCAHWTPSPEETMALLGILPASDRERIRKFHFEADRKRSLAACLLTRLLIRRMLPQLPPSDIAIERTEHGRPFLRNAPQGFDFNLSHHGDFCIIVGCLQSRVGVDVMKVELNANETADKFLDIFRDFQVTPHEWRQIEACRAPEDPSWSRLHAFFRLWCLKEAYTKTLGLGLGLDFKTIEFKVRDGVWSGRDGLVEAFDEDVSVSTNGVLQSGWYFHVGYLDTLHPFVIAVENKDLMQGEDCLLFEKVLSMSVEDFK
ncbi:holo-[acyl-carrier-protein] synthase [Chytriomyces confervae]|uniref:holo-[acyl-carrier-protein] synthase n=1 Tax=Chytriomyces confervae TaxID=246404 RepID=A0A507FMB6_9FUNG|nr:holo-[acyl-carrier-protein] synthase [Chytriomyces confervae]